MGTINKACVNQGALNLIEEIAEWHYVRNLIHGSSDQAQFTKLIEEAGELAGNIARGRDLADDIGDMLVVLINIMERNALTMEDCLEQAWNDIKDRGGRLRNGVFVKSSDVFAEGAADG